MLKDPVTVKESVTVREAVKLLHTRHIGSVVVTDKERRCMGIFTERDAIRAVAQEIPLQTPLRKVMSKKVITILEDATFAEAIRKMTTRCIRHLPVVNKEEKLVGLLTVRLFLDEFLGSRFEEA
jgi:CBS domain-containing protein